MPRNGGPTLPTSSEEGHHASPPAKREASASDRAENDDDRIGVHPRHQEGTTTSRAGGSCDTRAVRYVKNEEEGRGDDKCVRCKRESDHWVQPGMVLHAVPAPKRTFSIGQMLKQGGCYNVRKAGKEVTEMLLDTFECSAAEVQIPLQGKTSVQVRRELNVALANSLAHGKGELAFAKKCGVTQAPRADDIEAMVEAFPNKESIDWSAKPVESGINVPMWKCMHARHCKVCDDFDVARACYFRLIWHFLLTGFDPPMPISGELKGDKPHTRAYVDL